MAGDALLSKLRRGSVPSVGERFNCPARGGVALRDESLLPWGNAYGHGEVLRLEIFVEVARKPSFDGKREQITFGSPICGGGFL